jgi:hypothetical protein
MNLKEIAEQGFQEPISLLKQPLNWQKLTESTFSGLWKLMINSNLGARLMKKQAGKERCDIFEATRTAAHVPGTVC